MAENANKGYMSATQKKRLADIMANKPELRAGKFSSTFTKEDARTEWEDIAKILNALPGATKTWQSWRKSWQDLLSKTKSKKGAINQSVNRTGGGRPVQPLDEIEENVLSLIDPRSVSGHRESQESEAAFDFETHFTMGSDAIQAQSDEEEVTVVQVADEADAAEQPPEERRQKKLNLKSLMKEKIELKKKLADAKIKFYKEYIEEKKKQTAALEQIALAIRGQTNVL